ncbi:MAG: biotin--[Oscillospiraceae bacterium]|nr:biotin--[acetyl-CoA-carboxylase] ligase [Oscillospiraceae bacterium]
MELQKSILERLLPFLPPDRLILLEETDSTNLAAKRLALNGAPDGTVILAKRQTAGRGSAGRSFQSPDGGLYLTVLLRPKLPPEKLPSLTPLLAVAAAEAVERVCGVKPGIKWVNDLVVRSRKLAGILAETVFLPDGSAACAAGIGINCDAPQELLPQELRGLAIGLREITGIETDRNALAAELVRGVLRAAEVLASDRSAWMDRYRAACVTLGREVLVSCPEGDYRARAQRVDDDGTLYVEDKTNTVRRVAAGTVSVRGLYGYCETE